MGDSQDNYISIFQAKDMLNVSSERITWFITTEKLSSKRNPRDKSTKLVSLQDVLKLQNYPHLLARWVIYILRDPRDGAVDMWVKQMNRLYGSTDILVRGLITQNINGYAS